MPPYSNNTDLNSIDISKPWSGLNQTGKISYSYNSPSSNILAGITGYGDSNNTTSSTNNQLDMLKNQWGTDANSIQGVLGNEAYSLGNTPDKGIMSGLTDWFGQKGNVNMLNTGLGVAGVGMGLANYFAQKPLLDQQIKGAKLQNQAAQTQLAEHNKFMGQMGNLPTRV